MKTTMHRLVSGRLVSSMFNIAAVSVMFGSSLILAQESSREVANVPFAFHARETTLPAGTYVLKVVYQGVMQIADKETGHSIMVPTRGRQSGPNETPRLTFHRYGNDSGGGPGGLSVRRLRSVQLFPQTMRFAARMNGWANPWMRSGDQTIR